MRTRAIAISLGLLGLASCAQEPESTAPTGALVVSEQSATALAGTFDDGAMALSFQATEDDARTVALSIVVDELVVTLGVDELGGITIDSNGVVKTTLQQELLAAFHAAMIARFPDFEDAPPVERLTIKSLDWLEENDVGVPIPAVDTSAYRFSVVKVACEVHQHGLWNGSAWVPREVGQASTGGNGCWGRCGPGCSSNYSGVYSEDCGEHDHGLGPIGDCADDVVSSNNCRAATSGISYGYHAGMCNGASANHRHDSSGAAVIGGGACY